MSFGAPTLETLVTASARAWYALQGLSDEQRLCDSCNGALTMVGCKPMLVRACHVGGCWGLRRAVDEGSILWGFLRLLPGLLPPLPLHRHPPSTGRLHLRAAGVVRFLMLRSLLIATCML